MTKPTGEPNQSPTSASNYVDHVYASLLKKAGIKKTNYGYKKIIEPVKRDLTLREYQQQQRNRGEATSWRQVSTEQRISAQNQL